ncbi:Acyl carrier protein (Modular protein) (fragment) [Bosea sp. 127]
MSGRLRQELDRVADGHDRLGRVVRDLDAELFLESHDQLDGVEAVGTEVLDEIGALDNLLRLNAEVLDHDLLHALGDIAHGSFPQTSKTHR